MREGWCCPECGLERWMLGNDCEHPFHDPEPPKPKPPEATDDFSKLRQAIERCRHLQPPTKPILFD